MSEKNMWGAVRKVLVRTAADDAIRVENPAHPGTPDVHWCMGGVEGWLELKQVASWPVRPTTKLAVDHYTPQQRVWAVRRARAGGRTHLLIQVDSDWLLFRGEVAAEILGRVPRTELMSKVSLFCEGKLDGERLRAVLCR